MGVAFIWSSGARKSIDGISIDLVRWAIARGGSAVRAARLILVGTALRSWSACK
jgi:hypothetical protein